tara:strand:+ start:582 stop:1190 length:609 start_codon:yes stop_codon:yes gene_type:complete
MQKLVLLVALAVANSLYGQQEQPIYIIEGDTLANPYVDLGEVIVLPSLKFDSYNDYLSYYRLRKRTLKVYRYAKMASERLVVLNDRLSKIKRKRARKRYTKRVERYLEGEFKDELKRLTRSEGRILVKLIHRETGQTTHGLIKKLRSGWRAFVYQTTAKLFDIDLKTTYNPTDDEEDALIEGILLRAFADGTLHQSQEKIKK